LHFISIPSLTSRKFKSFFFCSSACRWLHFFHTYMYANAMQVRRHNVLPYVVDSTLVLHPLIVLVLLSDEMRYHVPGPSGSCIWLASGWWMGRLLARDGCIGWRDGTHGSGIGNLGLHEVGWHSMQGNCKREPRCWVCECEGRLDGG
jgi:hypothetical protein